MGISVIDEILERASRVKRLIGRPPGSFALRESEASATNVLSVRKRSVSNKCFICAKAKRQQQQMFSVAKAKRQLQSARSERKSTTRFGDEP
ncbi:hypothetical protein [Lysinibacillus sp. fls2-241-R2A-57]|uniref:hypothetical protein n=1 Tax=Lysinibacillus sp. fls2-241-R2A-57 TaxID=3040292 RepID=UPI002552280E|nr:hypothetical protein [Lysinibacillus sp. fls2-241-R2A-57]